MHPDDVKEFILILSGVSDNDTVVILIGKVLIRDSS